MTDRRRLLGMAVPFVAVVGSMIVGSSRSSTRTSPGACMTTWRITLGSFSWLVAGLCFLDLE